MTLLVGILCADGVVMASDSAATFGTGGHPTIGQQKVQKIQQVNDHILYAGTGAVGIGQLISNNIRDLWSGRKLGGGATADAVMDVVGKSINAMLLPYLQGAQFQRGVTGEAAATLCKSMVALPVGNEPHLFQFDFNGAPERATKELPFVALGSGQPIADPFLAFLQRLLWPDHKPTLSEGRLAAVWTISHVCLTNPGGVGGDIQLATLTGTGRGLPVVNMYAQADIQEHLQRVASAEASLVAELRGHDGDQVAPLPNAPAP